MKNSIPFFIASYGATNEVNEFGNSKKSISLTLERDCRNKFEFDYIVNFINRSKTCDVQFDLCRYEELDKYSEAELRNYLRMKYGNS